MNDGVVTEFNEANSNKFSIKCVIATILILYFMSSLCDKLTESQRK